MTKRTIEIDEDPAFQRKEWIAQRIGVGVLTLFLLAAVLGFTGISGPFSHSETSDPSGTLRVEYERVVRRGAPSTLVLHFHGSKAGQQSFWLSAEFFKSMDVESVVPDPEAVAAAGDRYVYTVRTTGSDAAIAVRTRSTRVGWIDVDLGVVDGPSLRFRQTSLF